MDFLRFLMRRIILGVVVLWLVTVGTFYLFFVSPPDVARTLSGKGATPQQVAGTRHRLGLDQPLIVQYWHYLDNLLHGFGVLSATRARSLLDRTTTLGVLVGYSMPTFVLGGLLLFVLYYQFSRAGIHLFQPGYAPLTQGVGAWASHMVLPWITLATVQVAVYSRLTRGSLLDVLGEDYIRTARAKGLAERRVIYRHGLRAALVPVTTQFGVDIATLISGAIVTETVFGLQGVGQSLVRAVTQGDLFFILGVVIVTAAAVVLANLIVDVAYSFLDPRVRLT